MLDSISTYIYTVYKQKSVSKAANELFISQPALSSAIKREEKRLGFEIFNRKTLPLTLTPEGKYYIEAIEKMQQIERDSMEKIDGIRNVNKGTLRIGISTHLSFYVVPKILKEFQKSYPDVDVHIIFTDTDKLLHLLESDTADIVLTTEKTSSEEYNSCVLLSGQYVVAVPRTLVPSELLPFAISHKELLESLYYAEKSVSDLSLFHNIEFIYTPPKTTMEKKRKLLFGKDDLHPYITSNAQRQQFHFNLMRAGFGALLTTDTNLATMQPDSSYSLFVINTQQATQDFLLVSKKDGALVTDKFTELAQTIFSQNKPLKELFVI